MATCHVFDDAGDFLSMARPFLLQDEVRNTLILGLAERVAAGTYPLQRTPYFAVVEELRSVLVAALRLPPQQLVLSAVADWRGLPPLVADVLARMPELNGVDSTRRDGEEFARLWQQAGGPGSQVELQQRIYRLDAVIPPPAPDGAARPAAATDRDLLVQWRLAFEQEAVGRVTDPDRSAQLIDATLAGAGPARGFFVWEDEVQVAMASLTGPTPQGVRVGAVYTPPQHRRRGYASALVAAISQQALDAGKRFCCLYTDLANPISNSIYQRIGYVPVCDAESRIFR